MDEYYTDEQVDEIIKEEQRRLKNWSRFFIVLAFISGFVISRLLG